jgi:hypothetical protein
MIARIARRRPVDDHTLPSHILWLHFFKAGLVVPQSRGVLTFSFSSDLVLDDPGRAHWPRLEAHIRLRAGHGGQMPNHPLDLREVRCEALGTE